MGKVILDREAFEEFIEQDYGYDIEHDKDGAYYYNKTQHDWIVWQAACEYRDEQKS